MGRFATEEFDPVRKAREEFLSLGTVPTGLVADTILRSWRRSAERGIVMGQGGARCTSRHDLLRRQDKNHVLLTRSRSVMEGLYQEISGTSSMVLLADREGVILHSIGDADFVQQAQQVSLKPGGIWSEGVNGTNAIGTSLVDQAPVLVHSAEHFRDINRFLTCAAAPIFDPRGCILGVLDVSGDSRTHQHHTMALVRLSAQMIENQMFIPEFPDDIVINFHLRPEFLGTHYEGIAVFAPDGRFIAANRSALLQLSLDRSRMTGESFSTIFGISLAKLQEQARLRPQPVLKFPLPSGIEIYGRVCLGTSASPSTIVSGSPVVAATKTLRPGESTEGILLEDLQLGDPKMQAVIGKVRRVTGHDIPIMIEGESGTGKELLAHALHGASPRRKGPFVPVNCAAIPEGLIESELFGYQEGAFTGARRKGHIGKIREADGGTLFLDEIGEMPLNLQARLLRVLQDRTVSPLGGSATHRVDMTVICATNRRVRDLVSTGSFREDLYYRLNGLLVTIPTLRERTDKLPLARRILGELSGTGRHPDLATEVAWIFESHPWPGNIRQMHNVLRTAVALLGDRTEITVEDLPEDFLEQAGVLSGASPLPSLEKGGEKSLAAMEESVISSALTRTGGNIAAASRMLGISRNTLYRKLRGTV
ncbi:sigma-54-dependent Fis family transcriptional regulator [Geobacter sp.]|uniref:sigma-54-dependent Fis family transcriptional regulator n=1 Tax=Geobacter sp. TaxID=46610 RepID=UPI0027B8E931|nr:sigma-54-dependent Fis family transcriptional regulator [Geobacter sp.]